MASTNYDAVKMLIGSSLGFLSKYDCHEWRLHRLWNEECDIVFKYYMNVLKALYDKFSGKFAKPGMPKYNYYPFLMSIIGS